MPKPTRAKQLKHLGELETDVLGLVREKRKVTVQEVKEALAPRRALAYTTVMTVLSRLAAKGLLERQKQGRAYYYTPAASAEKVAGSLIRTLVRRLYAGSTGKAIAQLLDTEDGVDDAELERLEALIHSKRRARRS
jgi:BlaI family penicillinase repressor